MEVAGEYYSADDGIVTNPDDDASDFDGVEWNVDLTDPVPVALGHRQLRRRPDDQSLRYPDLPL